MLWKIIISYYNFFIMFILVLMYKNIFFYFFWSKVCEKIENWMFTIHVHLYTLCIGIYAMHIIVANVRFLCWY